MTQVPGSGRRSERHPQPTALKPLPGKRGGGGANRTWTDSSHSWGGTLLLTGYVPHEGRGSLTAKRPQGRVGLRLTGLTGRKWDLVLTSRAPARAGLG